MSEAHHPPCQWMLKIFFTKHNWQDKQQKSWVIALWWFGVSPLRICITCVWPSGSQKLPAPSNQSERHLHFSLIRLCMALLFNISICLSGCLLKKINLFQKIWFVILSLKNVTIKADSFKIITMEPDKAPEVTVNLIIISSFK